MNKTKTYRILIVDDDEISLLQLKCILKYEYHVITVQDSREASLIAEREKPDIIILDVLMPELDGYGVMAELKDSYETRDIPVVFITGLDRYETEEKGLSLGAVDFISKPFNPEVVVMRIKNQIDILERQRQQMLMTQIKLKLTSEALQIALWEMDAVENDPTDPCNKILWSQEVRQMFGYDDENDFPNELRSWIDRLHPEDEERVLTELKSHIFDYTNKIQFNVEYRFMLKSGIYKHFHAFAETLRDSGGIPLRIAGAFVDIDNRKNEQNQNMIMTSIIRHTPSFIAYKKINGECLFINPAASDITGYSQEELKADYVNEIFGDKADEYANRVHEELMKYGISHFEFAGKKKDGTERTFGGTSFLIENDSFATIMSDVTKRNRLETEMVTALKEIKHRDKIMQAVNKAAALLLTMDDAENIEVPLMAGMELIGRSVELDRVHIWQLSNTSKDGSAEFIHSYCWSSNTGKQRASMPTGVTFPFGSKPEWEASFLRGESISGPVSGMAQDDQGFFNDYKVRSTVIIPLFLNEQFWGLFTVDDCVRERDFTSDEIAILKSISLMMASAINRRMMAAEIKEAHVLAMQQLEKLVDERTKELAMQTEILTTFNIKLKESERLTEVKYTYARKLNDSLAEITQSPAIAAGDLKAVADVIAKEGCSTLNAYRISVWRLSKSRNALVNTSTYDGITCEHSIQDDFSLSMRPEYKKMIETERIIVTNDTSAASYDIFCDGYGEDLCAVLDAPIRVDGKVVGVICAEQNRCEDYPEKREWLIEELTFVSSLADLIALAISGNERRKAREAAENANQAKSAFLASMSHEIRTPMNSILGVTDILLQNEILPADIEDGLNRIYTSSDMLLGIINDILDFSKIEAGKMDILPAEYVTASLINDSVQLNMTRIYDKPIEFEVQVDEKIPAKLIGDELRIKQVMNNLLSNAFKFTNSGKVSLSIVSEPLPNGTDVILVIIVRDTGRGMTDDQLNNLFQEYSRFDANEEITTEGTGLGLTITQRLITLMNGGIKVESQLGAGSTFTVQLPQKIVDNEVLGREVADHLKHFRMNYVSRIRRGQINRTKMPYGSVLLVDDVEANLYVAVGLLKPYALRIESVMSGQETLDLILSGKTYDIIFMDHMMPEMDGIEVTKRLRDFGYTDPIVALTANAVTGQADVFLENGFDEFISKPIDIRQLNTILNKYIRDKKSVEADESCSSQTESNESGDDEQTQNTDEEAPVEIDIAGLDTIKGLNDCDGNNKRYMSMLRSYAASVRLLLPELEGVDKDRLLEYKTKVHGIKGASRLIYAEQLGMLASELENAAGKSDMIYLEEHNRAFLDSAYKLMDDIDAFLSATEDKSGKPEKDKPDRELLQELLVACKNYNMEETDIVMEKIDEYQYKSDDGIAGWLRSNVDIMNYSKIIEKLSEMLEE